MRPYIVYHLHSDYSLLDSCTKFQDYADLAIKYGQKAIASTEHGKPLGWVSKKMYCDKIGIRYMVSMLRYFPITIFHTGTGAVRSS